MNWLIFFDSKYENARETQEKYRFCSQFRVANVDSKLYVHVQQSWTKSSLNLIEVEQVERLYDLSLAGNGRHAFYIASKANQLYFHPVFEIQQDEIQQCTLRKQALYPRHYL